MTKMMRAARMHDVGQPMVIEQIPVPSPRPTDVLVKVKACGIVPNLGNVLSNWQKWFYTLSLHDVFRSKKEKHCDPDNPDDV